MQKKSFTLFIVLLAVIFVMPSCKKYDDGPSFSFVSAKSRVANTWKIEKVYVNDVDQTSNSLFQLLISNYKIELTEDGNVTQTTGAFVETGTWTFEDSKANIAWVISGATTVNKILRLTSDEMWLEYTDANQKFVKHYVTF